MSLSQVYSKVVCRLKEGSKLLDLGCCFGQDIRKLVHDGVPPENLFGSDVNGGLMAAGHDFFLDRDTLRSEFFVADIFRQDSMDLRALEGKVDMVLAGSFFHLFDWDQQLAVAMVILKILQPRSGSMVFGHHLGNVHAGTYPFGLSSSGNIFKHDVASFQEFWSQIGEATGTHWHVDASLELMHSAGVRKDGVWGG